MPEVDRGHAFIKPGSEQLELESPINLLEFGPPKLLVGPEGGDGAKSSEQAKHALAYTYQRGSSQSFDLTLEGSLEVSLGPSTLPKQDQPVTRVRGIVHVESRGDGGASMRVEVTEVSIKGAGGDPFGLGAAAQTILRSSRIRVALDHRGLVRRSTLELPAQIDERIYPHVGTVVALAGGLGRLFVPLPLSAGQLVGGANWSVTDRYVDVGALVTQTTRYEVVAYHQDAKQVELSLTLGFEGQWWNKRPDESFGLDKYVSASVASVALVEPKQFELSGRGHGRIVLRLGEPIAVDGGTGAIRTTRSVVEDKGATQEAKVKQEIRLRYGADKSED